MGDHDVKLRRAGDGVYTTLDGRDEVQNPHGMDSDDDNQGSGTAHGPFDTPREVREFLAEQGKGKGT
jgi:hypothetical protein